MFDWPKMAAMSSNGSLVTLLPTWECKEDGGIKSDFIPMHWCNNRFMSCLVGVGPICFPGHDITQDCCAAQHWCPIDVSFTKPIYEIYRIWGIFVKLWFRKMRLWDNKKGKSIGSDSPFCVVMKIEYRWKFQNWYMPFCWRISKLGPKWKFQIFLFDFS